MTKLIVGASRSKKRVKIMSDLIVWWTRLKLKNLTDVKDVSHIYFKFVSYSWDRAFIYQSSGHASNFITSHSFIRDHIIVEEISLNLPDSVVLNIGKVCYDREGTKYAFMQNFGIALQAIASILFNKKIPNYFADGDKTTNCLEEAVVILCKEFNLPIPEGVESYVPWEARNWLVYVLLPELKRRGLLCQ